MHVANENFLSEMWHQVLHLGHFYSSFGMYINQVTDIDWDLYVLFLILVTTGNVLNFYNVSSKFMYFDGCGK